MLLAILADLPLLRHFAVGTLPEEGLVEDAVAESRCGRRMLLACKT